MMIRVFTLDLSAARDLCDRCSARAVYSITFGDDMDSLLTFCRHHALAVAAQHSDVPQAVLDAAGSDVPEITDEALEELCS